MPTMVEIKNLSKHFGPIVAVDDISFTVSKGEVLGFLGPNGAGKSTTMKMVTGFLEPTAGTAIVCGHDITQSAMQAKERLGYLPEGAPAYPDMTPLSFLRFCASVRGLKGPDRDKAISGVIKQVALEEVLYQPFETLSKGYKRRVGLAQAILHNPDVLILDEPTDGLDPNQKHEVRTLISSMAKNKAIILSTHILEEVEALCTRAIIIDKGKLVADGTPAELEARSIHHNAVTISLPKKEADDLAEALKGFDLVDKVEKLSGENGTGTLRIFSKNGKSIITEVTEAARAKNLKVSEIFVEKGRLDEVFRKLTSGKRT